MSLSAAGLALRGCTKCGQVDDHPRCHRALFGAGNVADLPIFHMDCHAQLGCPLCLDRLDGAGGLRGAELRDYLIANPLTQERVAELLGQPAPVTSQEG